MSWQPDQYLAFADLRERPALALLARVPLNAPERIADLGCGAGNITARLIARWPETRVLGVDQDAAMLAHAIEQLPPGPRLTWQQADLASWHDTHAFDLIFANASLHWLDDHEALFPRLMSMLEPGGVLAVQMPDNYRAPSHQCAYVLARDPRWADRLAGLIRPSPLLEPARYYDLLAPLSDHLDLWHTDYLQVMNGDNPVADWTRGSLLVSLHAALDDAERSDFDAAYRAAIASAYPRQADGSTLFPFRRFFIVARRR